MLSKFNEQNKSQNKLIETNFEIFLQKRPINEDHVREVLFPHIRPSNHIIFKSAKKGIYKLPQQMITNWDMYDHKETKNPINTFQRKKKKVYMPSSRVF